MKFLSIPRENRLCTYLNISHISYIVEYEGYVTVFMVGDSEPFKFESESWARRLYISDDSI